MNGASAPTYAPLAVDQDESAVAAPFLARDAMASCSACSGSSMVQDFERAAREDHGGWSPRRPPVHDTPPSLLSA